MKRGVFAGLACLAVFFISVPVFAHGKYYCDGRDCEGNYCFIDEDGDGICDNSLCVDEDGNSVCGNRDENDVCRYFIDEDEDGICDHCVNEDVKKANAQSVQRHCACRSSRRGNHHRGVHH